MRAVLLLGLNLNARSVLAPADELLIARRSVASPQTAQVERLQNVGLALRVRPGEYGHAAVRRDDRLLVISEIFETQRFNAHIFSINNRAKTVTDGKRWGRRPHPPPRDFDP